ncbi:MAG: hypothetical protein GC154_10775 [bacterium]|nr:hypothetical protein [bacterium]
MEAYIQTALQVRDDLMEEVFRDVPSESPEASVAKLPHGELVMDNVHIFFRNSAKNKLFSERIRGVKGKRFEENELLPAYITTSDDESYQDALDSIGCCKKIAYFLFISRFEQFQITERNHFSEKLRRLEAICPNKAVETYNVKKQLIDLMGDEEITPTYEPIVKLVSRYILAIKDLLDAQAEVYRSERKLVEFFNDYLAVLIDADPNNPHARKLQTDASFVKALKQTIEALDKRGLDLPELQPKMSRDFVKTVGDVLKTHRNNLAGEIKMISDVTDFLNEVVEFSDARFKAPPEQKKEQESSLMSLLGEFSSSFSSWLRQ